MKRLGPFRVKRPYGIHRVPEDAIAGMLPPVEETNAGALVYARVVAIGRHKELEDTNGRRMAIFPGDVILGVLGNRYATDQYHAVATCEGPFGHISGIGGVVGRIVSKNSKMPDPTVVEWLGRPAGVDGSALHLRDFAVERSRHCLRPRPRTLLSVGASMNSGKTTTAAYAIRSLAASGRRVMAAKITGTACRKDLGVFEDAGAERVLDFTWAGHPSTAGCSADELLAIARELHNALATERPDDIVIEIADGVVQRETRILLEDPTFRACIDAVTFAGPDALSCDAGVRLLRELDYNVVAVSGLVSGSPLGMAEAEAATGLPCLSLDRLLEGELLPKLESKRAA
jgi:hypothetical protein